MIRLITLFIFIVLLSSVYQDFPLVKYFGEIARSPVVFLAPIMLVYIFLHKKIYLSSYGKTFFLYIVYLIGVSLIFVLFFYLRNDSFFIFDENVILKTFKMTMYPIVSYILYLFIFNYLNRSKFSIFILTKQIYVIQLILLTIMIVECLQNSDGFTSFQFLHSSEELYWRIRLLTMESSWSGSVAIVFSLLPVYFINKGLLRYNKGLVYVSSFSFLILYTILSESKGYLLLFIISILPNLYKVLKRSQYKKYIIPIIIAGIIISGFVFVNLYDNVTKQFYSSITFGTRFSSYFASLRAFFLHPFGVGLGPYMFYYTESIKAVIDTGWMNMFNLNEISHYLNTTKALSTKTYFFDQLVFGGLGFLLFFYSFFYLRYKKMNKNNSENIPKIILLFIVLSGMIYITYHVKYEVWIFLALTDYLEKKQI